MTTELQIGEETYIVHECRCKFCGVMLKAEISKDYSELGDPLNILPIAACNRCADLRVRKRKIVGKINFDLDRWLHLSRTDRSELEDDFRKSFRAVINDYCKVCSELQGRKEYHYDSEIVETILSMAEFEPEPGRRKEDEIPKLMSDLLTKCWNINKSPFKP